MVGKEDVLIFFLLIWVGILVPFDPSKKNVIYNGTRKTRVFCGLSGLIGIITMIFYEIYFNNPSLANIIECLIQFASIVLIICSMLCYRELLLRKNPGIVFKIVAVLSAILIAMGMAWLILYWCRILNFDVYLFMAPPIGSIMLSAYGSKDNSTEKEFFA